MEYNWVIMIGRYVLTGGAGFIGSNIAEQLVENGDDVKVIDNLETGSIKNLEPFMDKIKFVEGSIRDADLLQKEFAGYDYVLHLAAMPSVAKSVKDPLRSVNVNLIGTLNVLIAARDNNMKRVVFSGSSSVYGESETLPKVETMEPKPISPYAIAKLAAEQSCRVFCNLYGIDTITLRYFNVFGEKQDPDSEYSAVIPKFIKLMLNRKSPVMCGDGKQTRDFTYIKNVVNANILACKAEKTNGETVNIATGKRIDLIELTKRINEILGTDIEYKLGEPRQGDIKHSLADIRKAKKLIGYEPEYDFKEGLVRTIEWIKKNG